MKYPRSRDCRVYRDPACLVKSYQKQQCIVSRSGPLVVGGLSNVYFAIGTLRNTPKGLLASYLELLIASHLLQVLRAANEGKPKYTE